MNATNVLSIIILIVSVLTLLASQFIDHSCDFNESYMKCLNTSPTYFWFNFVGTLGIVVFGIIKFIQWDKTFTLLANLIKKRRL